jgi:hypothetical protein
MYRPWDPDPKRPKCHQLTLKEEEVIQIAGLHFR